MNPRIRYTILSFLWCLLVSIPLCAQSRLDSSTNALRIGDSIVRRQIGYFAPGAPGEGRVWDLRYAEGQGDDHALRFHCDSDSVVLYGLEPRFLRKYCLRSDSLLLLGYETRLQTLDYASPVPLLGFPCSYGDHTLQPLHATGSYCRKYAIEAQGTFESEADATGTIYYNESDTLHHVLRLHQIYASSIRQYLPADSLVDTLNIKQRIEEHYLWYARGYRYPVFETVSTTVYDDLVPVSVQLVAYCSLPSDQVHLEDSVNRQIQQEDSLQHVRDGATPPPLQYQVDVHGSDIQVNYTLEADATLQLLVCDRMGLVYRRASASGLSGESGSVLLSTSGLKREVYILYLNVNGQVISEKIDLR